MLKKLKPKSEFSRNVMTLMTGSGIAQAIPIAISPIITRIYTPEDFGILALYMSIASILSVIATGRYELAIMLPKKDVDALNIVILSMLISCLMSLSSFVVVFFFNTQITNLLGNSDLSVWLYLLPISIILTGIYQSLNYWNNRKKYYKELALGRIIQSGTGSSFNLGFGFLGFGGGGLIFSGFIGQVAATSFLSKIVWKEDSKLLIHINKLKIIALMKKHKKLPLYNLPNSIIDTFKMSAINILISKFFTTAVLGQYSLAWRMLVTPASLVGNSLSQVFFQKLASTKKSQLNKLIIKFILKASMIALPMFLIVYFFSIDIFMFIFGPSWKLAGEVASILSPWLFFNFISSPLSTVYIILNKQEIMLFISMFYMIVPISILYVLRERDFIYVLHVLSFSMSAVLICLIGLILYLTFKIKKED